MSFQKKEKIKIPKMGIQGNNPHIFLEPKLRPKFSL